VVSRGPCQIRIKVQLRNSNIKATVARAAEIRKENESRGFKVMGHYWTQG
jgi:hypothetical protein